MESGSPLDPALLAEKIAVGGEILWALSGRQFSEVCVDSVRPTRHWFRTDWGPPYRWQYGREIGYYSTRPPHRDDGAFPLPELTLGVYPLRRIVTVRVDGAVIAPSSYRIDDRRWLVNLTPNVTPWPTAQDMSADPLTATNTMLVDFEYGQAAPAGGVSALKAYAIELAKGASGDPCQIPQRVLNMQMQGVSYTVLDPLQFLDAGRTGLYEVDVWLRAVNPKGMARRSTVLSPDRPRPVRRTSTVPGS